MAPVASMMDDHHGDDRYQKTLLSLRRRLKDPSLPPSARMLEEMAETNQTFFRVAMKYATRHREYFLDTPLDRETEAHYQQLARDSLRQQQEIEQSDDRSFDQFLADYYRQYDFQL